MKSVFLPFQSKKNMKYVLMLTSYQNQIAKTCGVASFKESIASKRPLNFIAVYQTTMNP